MKKRKLTNAYEAYWFLYEHPAFMTPFRFEVTPEEAADLEAKGYWITRDKGTEGKCYRMFRHMVLHAINENLDIHYTKTSTPGGHGTVDKDRSKNKFVEVWLEFGTIYYGYTYSGDKEPMSDWDTETALMHEHDMHLDCGGTTFDEALVNLAKNVLEKYGDYEYDEDAAEGECGKPVCADCHQRRETAKELGIE